MSNSLLFEDGYEYNYQVPNNKLNIHFDYGLRFHEINMKFLHFHPFYEVYILLSGKAQHIIEGQLYELEEMDIVLLRPYRLHKSVYYENTACSRLIFTFDLHFFETYFAEASVEISDLFIQPVPIMRFNDSLKEELIHLYNTLFLTSKNKSAITDFMVTGHFIHFLSHVMQNRSRNLYQSINPSDSDHSETTLDNKIRDIVSYIHQNYASHMTLESLSEHFYISPSYLSRKFKQVTHFSLVNYIQQTRVKRAQELLLNTNMKITTIMETCGFGSLSQFNRVFCNITELSPSEYRKQHKLLLQQNYL